jgi:MFS family permease
MFLSTYVIDTKGLRACIVAGCLIMLFGSSIRMLVIHGSFWPVFFGHIISLSGQAFLKNPVNKLTNNWFGDNERGFATGISIMSGPAGIFISKVLI